MQQPRAQAGEDHARQRLSQDVRPLVLGGDVARSEDEPGDDVPQEVGVAQDVLRLLERDSVESEVDGGLRVEQQRRRSVRQRAKLDERLAVEDALARR